MTRTLTVRAAITVMLLLGSAPAWAAEAEAFELKDRDRVAFIGGTLIEREQSHSYLETLLRTRWPDRDVTFRNLGWSGDNVFGASRGYFEGAEQGFARLDKIVHELKPTVLFVSYGMAESFEGEAGLPAFRTGLEKMLDMLKDLNARTVLIGPNRHENLGAPLPDPTEHNRNLRLYADAMKDVASKRGHRYIDLFDMLGDGTQANPPAALTNNGIHFTAYGYWRAALAIEKGLGLPPRGWDLLVFRDDAKVSGTLKEDAVVVQASNAGAKILLKAQPLPVPPPPGGAVHPLKPGHERRLRVVGLSAGNYVLSSGGERVAAGTAEQWAQGVEIVNDAAAKSAEKIRQLAIQKNVQHFNQWRPANETYIFGFRAKEQGQNAAEMPKFSGPIAELEAQITSLAQPVETIYELSSQ